MLHFCAPGVTHPLLLPRFVPSTEGRASARPGLVLGMKQGGVEEGGRWGTWLTLGSCDSRVSDGKIQSLKECVLLPFPS